MAKIKLSQVCPNERTLEKLVRHELSEGHRVRVMQHTDNCDSCSRRVSRIAGGDAAANPVDRAMAKRRMTGADEDQTEAADKSETRKEPRRLEKAGDQRPVRSTREAEPAIEKAAAEDSSVMDAKPKKSRPYDFLAPPRQMDELGRLGSYRALEVLGAGGMGVVFRAEDILLRRQAALKVMLPDIAAGPTGKARFLREARAAASIKHDHVVTIYQVDEVNGVPFIAMELLKGESLEGRLKRDRKLSAAEIIHIGREIAEGLAAAHDLGLVHRDIKPANIWLEARTAKRSAGDDSFEGDASSSSCKFRVKILDFGLACGTEDDSKLTRQGTIVGTAAYMSPEQARGRGADARSDLFSLGSLLYVMCCGKNAHQGTDQISTLVAVVSSTPTHVRELNPTLPAGLTDLVMQLMEKKPADRPQSAQDVARKLADLENDVRSARRDTALEPASARTALKRGSARTNPNGAGSIGKQPAPFWRRARVLMSLSVLLILLAGSGAWLAAPYFQADPAVAEPASTPVPIPKGTVVFKTAYDNVVVRISSGNEQVAIVELQDSQTKEIALNVGNYDVELLNDTEEHYLSSRHVTIQEGQRSEVEVLFEPRAVVRSTEANGVIEPMDANQPKGKVVTKPAPEHKSGLHLKLPKIIPRPIHKGKVASSLS